jgi:hypothetical protein
MWICGGDWERKYQLRVKWDYASNAVRVEGETGMCKPRVGGLFSRQPTCTLPRRSATVLSGSDSYVRESFDVSTEAVWLSQYATDNVYDHFHWSWTWFGLPFRSMCFKMRISRGKHLNLKYVQWSLIPAALGSIKPFGGEARGSKWHCEAGDSKCHSGTCDSKCEWNHSIGFKMALRSMCFKMAFWSMWFKMRIKPFNHTAGSSI